MQSRESPSNCRRYLQSRRTLVASPSGVTGGERWRSSRIVQCFRSVVHGCFAVGHCGAPSCPGRGCPGQGTAFDKFSYLRVSMWVSEPATDGGAQEQENVPLLHGGERSRFPVFSNAQLRATDDDPVIGGWSVRTRREVEIGLISGCAVGSRDQAHDTPVDEIL